MPGCIQRLRALFAELIADEQFIRKVLVHTINNRVQDFEDPLTSTLIIMVNSPLQLVVCEAGIMIFRTNTLPVFPFDKLGAQHKQAILSIVEAAGVNGVTEAYHGCGKHTVQVSLGAIPPLGKRQLLSVFVQAMTTQRSFSDQGVMKQLCNIILQRFLSSISVPSEDIKAVMEQLWGSAAAAGTAAVCDAAENI